MQQAKNPLDMNILNFSALIQTLPAQLDRLENTPCQYHPNNKISCFCLNQKCDKYIICSKCIIEDKAHYKTCVSKGFVDCIEDFGSKILDVLKTGSELEKNMLNKKLNIIKESLVQYSTQQLTKELNSLIELVLIKFKSDLELSNAKNSLDQTKQNNGTQENIIQETEDEWKPVKNAESSLEKFCDKNVIQHVNISDLGKIIVDVYHQLQFDPVIRHNTSVNELDDNMARKFIESPGMKKLLESYSKYLVNKISAQINNQFNLRPDKDLAKVCKRFSQVNGPYNYQEAHAHNSISFKLNQETWFFGFSMFNTQEVDNQQLTIKLTKGERTIDDDLIFEFNMTFLQQEDVQLTGQTPHTVNTWIDCPVLLEGEQWYTLSFDKTVSTNIYYGSSIIRNPVLFGDNDSKSVLFKRAACDQYDNSDSVGQFPDFYLM